MWSSLRGSERYARCSNISCAVFRASCKRRGITNAGYCATFAFAAKEYHSTSPSSAPKRTLSGSPNPTRRVVTLDPTKLNAADWKDWSGKCVSRVWTKTPAGKPDRPPYGLEYYNGRPRYLPYPPHARGFLYYHPANSNVFAPEFNEFDVGHIRFRCVPSPVTPFHAGEDLVLPTGAPWHLSGTRLSGMGSPLLNLALCESLISADEVVSWSLIHPGVYRNNGATRYIRRFDQPFVIDLAVRRNSLVFAPTKPYRDEDKDEHFLFRIPATKDLKPYIASNNASQAVGVIVCRFEVYAFDDHGEPNTVALRIDRVLEPATQVASLSVTVPQPVAGELLKLAYTRQESGRPRNASHLHLDVRTWTLKLDSTFPRLAAIQRVGRRLHAMYMAQCDRGATAIHAPNSQ